LAVRGDEHPTLPLFDSAPYDCFPPIAEKTWSAIDSRPCNGWGPVGLRAGETAIEVGVL